MLLTPLSDDFTLTQRANAEIAYLVSICPFEVLIVSHCSAILPWRPRAGFLYYLGHDY